MRRDHHYTLYSLSIYIYKYIHYYSPKYFLPSEKSAVLKTEEKKNPKIKTSVRVRHVRDSVNENDRKTRDDRYLARTRDGGSGRDDTARKT